MNLSSEAKKHLRESLQQQCLNQKLAEYNKAKKLLTSLTDLDRGHTYYKYWLASDGRASSADRNDTALLEIYSQYIIRTAGKGYTVIDHPTKVYGMPNTHKCIDGNRPLHLIIDIDARQKPDPSDSKLSSLDSEKITHEDLMSRILVAYADALSLIPDCMPFLNSFALASSSNANKCSWHIIYLQAQFVDYRELKSFTEKVIKLVGEPYSKFIDIGLPKKHFNLRLLGLTKEVQPKENYSEIWPQIFSPEEPVKQEFQPIDDENILVEGANLVIAKYGWLQIGRTEKGFINFEAQSVKECPICDIKYDKNQLYEFIRKNGYFIFKYYYQKQYKPDYKGLSFNKEMKDAPKAYPNFLSENLTTTLIRLSVASGKTKKLREILNFLAKNRANLPCFN
ncbi:hypothetical protein G9A89_000971 [Geosiphon pyriformis]|nr:hypothetical protein G9A89_000971 [Geosiphon pyriformis]